MLTLQLNQLRLYQGLDWRLGKIQVSLYDSIDNVFQVLKRWLSAAAQFVSEHWRWVKKPKIGGKYRLPPVIRWVNPDVRGWPTATAGQGFILTLVFGWGGGAISWAWTRITQVPSAIVAPLLDYHRSSGYRLRTLARNASGWAWGLLVGGGRLTKRGVSAALDRLRT